MGASGVSCGSRGTPPQRARPGCPRQGGSVTFAKVPREGPARDPGRPRLAASGTHLLHGARGQIPPFQVSATSLTHGRRSRIPQAHTRTPRGSGAPLSRRGASSRRKRG
ncbi:hypothetical protein NDU88_002149 [Pleurodeles waltl]|uniref:Uncharacterized protein n=1 Tax=Pleurodeles waltl TaxID=8319 RepID=A0AAV7U9N1_PLEWA|nr:hypothetical protein NDU88_002149 [Pleurodeles waltl]